MESRPPAAVLLACVVLSTFAALHCKPRPVSCSSRQTPQSLNKTRPAPAYAVQTRPPCGDDTERAGDTTPARANVDNTDTQTKAPPVWERPAGWNTIRRPAWRPYAPPLNVDNTDNTRKRTPPRRSFARVQRLPFTALHCKTRGVSCSRRQTPRRVEKRRPPRVQRLPFRLTYHKPAPFSCSRRRKPESRHPPRRGVQRPNSPPEYRQRGQYGHHRPTC